jgi:hypothetical protein
MHPTNKVIFCALAEAIIGARAGFKPAPEIVRQISASACIYQIAGA